MYFLDFNLKWVENNSEFKINRKPSQTDDIMQNNSNHCIENKMAALIVTYTDYVPYHYLIKRLIMKSLLINNCLSKIIKIPTLLIKSYLEKTLT